MKTTHWYQKGIDAFNAHKKIGEPCKFPFEMDFENYPVTNDYNVAFQDGYNDAEKHYEEQSTNSKQLVEELQTVLNRFDAVLYIDSVSIKEQTLKHFPSIL